ncbi:hypothetical protein LSH36_987g00066 [Paralvinella palmiformis]|uniref:Uncharacterized protein n=1 Tax=Paralvinella palmiformis TaxID=53620 RepID=A0AAD9IX53_9ANNE|nr:hypothetical protein LSH36_987g00066 [Paralvinella palmiformis]
MQMPDRRLSLIVDLNQVLTQRSELEDASTVHDVTGRVSAMRIALRTAGNRVVCFTSSIIPRELSSSGLCFCTSYNARASTKLSMSYISLTNETMCLNSSLSICCISLSDFPETGSRNPCTGHRWWGDSTTQWSLLHSVRWTWRAHRRGIVKSMPSSSAKVFTSGMTSSENTRAALSR